MDASSDPDDAKTIGICEANRQLAQIKRRHQNLVDRVRNRSAGAPAILCIPARMSTLSSEGLATYWRSLASDMTVVVANAGSSYPSVIQLKNGVTLRSDKHANQVQIQSLV